MYYIAHRLFAAHDRALAAQLAHDLGTKVGHDQVFLPFCDTSEEDLVADIKGQRLYELDRDRLRRISTMIAILHGPSLDDGVCMEIGYAAALGVPIILLTTDFQTYSLTPEGPRLHFPDPLLEVLATRVIRTHRLGTEEALHATSRFEQFTARNHQQVTTAVQDCVRTALSLPAPSWDHPVPARKGTAVLEPAPLAPPEPTVEDAVQAAGYTTTSTSRFLTDDPLTAARNDWNTARHAELLVADVSGPETPPGAALLLGAAAARGQKSAAYLPRTVYTHADGREPNARNLMIQYSTDLLTTSSDMTRKLR
ncbi:nucleoside 2-deoxyribosyltransferase [Streptomyces sp. NPDC020667]|uniref:nucleoside 2-deoxyribosyltransferase n=1 Tax=Streptomyces sp. NPDC020667 TaxID=3154895 RepID=UPI0033FEB18F